MTVAIITLFLVADDALKANRQAILVIGCLIAFALLWKVPDVLSQRRNIPPDHPVIIELKRFGDLEAVPAEVDRELRENRIRIGRIGITENGLVYPGLGTLSLVRLDEIVWVYPHMIRHRKVKSGTGKLKRKQWEQ